MYLLTQSKNNIAALELMRHLGVCEEEAAFAARSIAPLAMVVFDGLCLANAHGASPEHERSRVPRLADRASVPASATQFML